MSYGGALDGTYWLLSKETAVDFVYISESNEIWGKYLTQR